MKLIPIRILYTANSSILYSKEKINCPDIGHLTSILSECFWPLLFRTNRISKRINKLSENLTVLSIFTLTIKQFLWKYHILPREEGGSTPFYKPYRYVPPHRVGFLRCFGLKTGIHFVYFGLKTGMIFEGSTGCMNVFIVSIPNE